MVMAVLSVSASGKFVRYNKLKQGNFQKTDVGGESQDICQELAVTSDHTKSFFFSFLEILKNMAIIGRYMLHS